MTKFLFFLFAIGAFFPALAQGTKGTWNPITCTYVNTTHKISWTLPVGIDWRRVDATGPNICFKAIDSETGVMLTLNVKTDQKYGTDVWPYYSDMDSNEYKNNVKKGARANGVDIKSMDVYKSQLNGIHAIKTTTSMRKNDPGLGGNVDMISIGYTFVINDKLYSVDVQALTVVKDSIEGFYDVVDLIFKGVKISK